MRGNPLVRVWKSVHDVVIEVSRKHRLAAADLISLMTLETMRDKQRVYHTLITHFKLPPEEAYAIAEEMAGHASKLLTVSVSEKQPVRRFARTRRLIERMHEEVRKRGKGSRATGS